MISLVDTFGGGPVAAAHIVYIHLSDELSDLSIHDLSGRSDGKLLSDTFSALVRSTTHGAALEDFICHKTGREVFTSANVPSFLRDDPDFYVEEAVESVVMSTTGGRENRR